ncbi:PREDICTED: nucleoporin NDC1-like [Nicrophorus vespilloides]|uniref:Nucleoporin NDC1-like n=1 Tax=Nicrophorus vespilloides TaxID=110193 RepID=A0ABM1M4F6_NICVS|nr:PREDICTED: nucleoporin NDC1-like [Nicrophorus vespilloides]
MQPNLVNTSSIHYKNILLRKLSCAVISSVLSQFIILILYIFCLQLNIFSPLDAVYNVFNTFATFTTWLYIVPFSIIIFAQSLICAKDYIVHTKYCSTRFQKAKQMFSVHNLFLLVLHVIVGFVCVWLFSAFRSKDEDDTCNGKLNCMSQNSFYFYLLGAWTGCYYFLSIYTSEKKIMFPVAQQKKWLQFKANFTQILKTSNNSAMYPIIYFVIFYFFLGKKMEMAFSSTLMISIEKTEGNMYIYMFTWVFGTMIFFYLNLMTFFYEMFLTEPLHFNIVPMNPEDFTLGDGISANVPIVQHLACYDLFVVSGLRKERREVLFTLSQPGGHPHNWNNLIEKLLKILRDYTELLNKSTSSILVPKNQHVNEHMLHNKTINFEKLRNMAQPSEFTVQNVTVENKMENFREYVHKKMDILKEKLGINFIFGELPEASIQKCLGDGQVIMWITQSLSSLSVASLKEDKYGIVLKDLPVIISCLVELKQSMEKLNRVPALNRKGPGMDDFNYRMKLGVTSAVRRSLYNICFHFGPYLKDLNLKKEILVQLNGFVQPKC